MLCYILFICLLLLLSSLLSLFLKIQEKDSNMEKLQKIISGDR